MGNFAISAEYSNLGSRKRWWALTVICLGVVMIVGDVTAVVVALPTIKSRLGFSDASLVWVLNAYLVTYAGFLLLGGRLADLFGHRRVFLWGLMIFTLASLACALPRSPGQLIAARAVQGVGAAIVATTALSLITYIFAAPHERAKAIGVYVFACSGGSLIGLILGGVLTSVLSWRWIFLVNLPLGSLVYVVCRALIPEVRGRGSTHPLDFAGATAVTTSLVAIVYAVVNGNEIGWLSARTLALFSGAAAAFILFVVVETRTQEPLVSLRSLRNRNLVVCCVTGALYAVSGAAGVLLSLYLQWVLGYGPLQVALALLPCSLVTSAFALGLSARLVIRFGIKLPLVLGLSAGAAGLLLFARAPVAGNLVLDVFPGLILIGLGAGVAYNPIFVASITSVSQSEAGLASGVINTSSVMGRALGLAALASSAAAHTKTLLAAGMGGLSALNAGYHVAFFIGAVSAAVAAVVAVGFLQPTARANASYTDATKEVGSLCIDSAKSRKCSASFSKLPDETRSVL
jgi:EmrB/QacA subfamily drug resistance transporter